LWIDGIINPQSACFFFLRYNGAIQPMDALSVNPLKRRRGRPRSHVRGTRLSPLLSLDRNLIGLTYSSIINFVESYCNHGIFRNRLQFCYCFHFNLYFSLHRRLMCQRGGISRPSPILATPGMETGIFPETRNSPVSALTAAACEFSE